MSDETPTPDQPADEQTVEPSEIDKANAVIKKLRSEKQAQQHQLNQLQQQLAQTAEQGQQQQAQADQETTRRLQALMEKSARAEIRAAAASKFADPEDAAVYLKAADFIDENGDVREYELNAAIDDLLDRKPHLAKKAAQSGPRQPAPDSSQGRSAGTAATEPRDIFGAWLKTQLGRTQ